MAIKRTVKKRCLLCTKPHFMGDVVAILDSKGNPMLATLCNDCERKLRIWVDMGVTVMINHPDVPTPLVFTP
jgi:hypothetical protein